MPQHVSDIAFTPAVKAQQVRLGSRNAYAKMEGRGGWSDRVTPDLAQFIGERDSFYLGTASADGQPYIQHRGGPTGFLKVVDDHTLAFADFSGNAQYISIGNLIENDKAFLFLMDYPNRKRIKIGSPKVHVGHFASLTLGGGSSMLVSQSMIPPMSADAEWRQSLRIRPPAFRL